MGLIASQTKIWVGKSRKFCNRSMRLLLKKKNDIEMYLNYIKGRAVVVERFVRTLKKNIYKYLTSISKNMCTDKLGDILNKYSNTYHSTINIKSADVTLSPFLQEVTLKISLKMFL